MLRAVTFDLWNTLIEPRDYGDRRVKFLVSILEDRGVAEEDIARAYKQMQATAIDVWLTPPYRFFTIEERVDLILTSLDLAGQVDGYHKAVVHYFEEAILEDPPGLLDGVIDLLEYLHGRVKMAIISDTGYSPGRVIREILRDLGIAHYFDVMVFSDEVGVNKPNRLMFSTALEELGVDPPEAMHVGDLPCTDIQGAKDMGMLATWLKHREPADFPRDALEPDHVIVSMAGFKAVLQEHGL